MKTVIRNLIAMIILLSIIIGGENVSITFASSYEIGDYVTFGKIYEEPILWRIINIDDHGNALLFSEKILAFFPYNPRYRTSDWENSFARYYLNAESEIGFLNVNNFSAEEQEAIVPTTVNVIHNELLTEKETSGTEVFNPSGNGYTYAIDDYLSDTHYKHYQTTEKVFLLSIGELKQYVYEQGFPMPKKPTEGAVDNISSEYSIREIMGADGTVEDPNENSGYFLRGSFHGDASSDESVPYVSGSYTENPGKIWPETATYENFLYSRGIGYAPALYLDMTKTNVYSVIQSTNAANEEPVTENTAPVPINQSTFEFDLSALDHVTDEESARDWIQSEVSKVNVNDKNWVEQFQLYLESGLSKIYTYTYTCKDEYSNIGISQELVANNDLNVFKAEVEQLLLDAGITLPRPLKIGQTIIISGADRFSFTIYPQLDISIDYLLLSFNDMTIKITKPLVDSIKDYTKITVTKLDTSQNAYAIDTEYPLPENLILGLPPQSSNFMYQVALKNKELPVGGKYNPGNGRVWFRVKDTGTYNIEERFKDFDDIQNLSTEVQDAIHVLASKGIINGTSNTAFSPDKSISRAEVAALILTTISKLDPDAPMPFKDITSRDWYYSVAASAKKIDLMNGITPEQFAPTKVIPKDQIVAVIARTLRIEMGYYNPANVDEILKAYSDFEMIQSWSKNDIAYSRFYNLDVLSANQRFAPKDEMTRGDAALLLYNLHSSLWD